MKKNFIITITITITITIIATATWKWFDKLVNDSIIVSTLNKKKKKKNMFQVLRNVHHVFMLVSHAFEKLLYYFRFKFKFKDSKNVI